MINPDVRIIRCLLEAENKFVSGSQLARELGMTRVSIWSRLEKLKEEGFSYDAVRNKGYCLTGLPEKTHPTLLQAILEERNIRTPVHYYPEIDSTNSEAERLIAQGESTPFVVLASLQHQGRGRLGRQWHSQDTGNIYMSAAFRPHLPPSRMQKFTLWMGISIAEAINDFLSIHIQVKWPNDLVYNGLKVAGMLTEARIDADQTRDLIFGLGLNVNSHRESWPDEIRNKATSLAAICGEPIIQSALAVTLVENAIKAYNAFIDGSYQSSFQERWAKLDGLKGQIVRTSGGHQLIGKVLGIDADGALRLLLPDGSEETCSSGEVSLQHYATNQ